MLNFHNDIKLYPCGKCKKECLGSKKMNAIECDVCLKWYHAECADLEFTFESYVESDLPFICCDKCSMKLIPFSQIINPSDVEELDYNLNSFPCKVCNEQCLGYDLEDCIQCDFCLDWLHYECTKYPYKKLEKLAKSNKPFSCDIKRCDMRNFPYHSIDNTLLLGDNFNSLITSTLLQSVCSSSLPDNHNSGLETSKSFFNYIPFPTSKTVYYDQFLDINCNYLSPEDLDDSLLNIHSNDLVVYHNNIRSLNKNFCKLQDELFHNCSNYPDILAFTETRISKDSSIPSLEGYSFEHVDAPRPVQLVELEFTSRTQFNTLL